MIFFGVLLMLIFVAWRFYQVRILSFNIKEITQVEYSGINPSHIKAYPVGVDIDIKPAVINNGVWPIFNDSAGYVVNGNNLIIYGHNKNNIFGPIRWMKVDNQIELMSTDGDLFKFKVITTDIVEPNNLNYIQKTSDETLTLYTCTGFLDSKRFIVVAKRVN